MLKKSQTPNPKSQVENPKSQVENPKSQIPNPKIRELKPKSQIPNSKAAIIFITLGFLLLVAVTVAAAAGLPASRSSFPPIVFVARAHLATEDTIFSNEVGPAGQFGTGLAKYAPGSRLVRRDGEGTLFVYNTPGLVDVQSPDVNFEGTKIVFVGARTLDRDSADYGWRLYEINVDGSGFHQLTFADRNIVIPNADQFGNQETYGVYHDLFPAYLADGRIVFTSSRYPSRAHYDERASYNLYVMNGNGSGLHRITTERGGLLHPTPLPDGRILLTRWWNQFNQPSDQGIYNRIDNANSDQILPDGTVILANPDEPFNPALAVLPGGYGVRQAPNTWHLMVVNPDGTEFKRYAWTPRYEWAITDDSGHYDTYAATQPAVVQAGDELYVAYTMQTDSSMVHSTLKTGIRVARPGIGYMYTNTTDAIAGLSYDQAWGQGNENGPYALHPWGMPDGRVLYSQSSQDNSLPTAGIYEENGESYELQGSHWRYELYTMNLDGTGKTVVPINLGAVGLGTADVMDAKPIVARSGWTALADSFTSVANDDPRLGNVPNTLAEYWFSLNGPNDIETATVHNPNIYGNPSLYTPFANNAPPPGSVATAEIWIDANQFTGAYCYNGWPQPCGSFRQDNTVRAVLWTEVPVTLQGAFTATVPADTMGFVVLRDANGSVVRGWNRGYISIAQGSAWARPGETVRCTGCHMGHVSGSLDDVIDEVEAGWTNVAPYAVASASSYHAEDDQYDPFVPGRVNDRRGWVPVPAGGPDGPYQDEETGWMSALGSAEGQWLQLSWPSAVTISSLRLVGPPAQDGDWGGFGEPAQYGDYYVENGTIQLSLDGNPVGAPIQSGRILPLTDGGTLIVLDSPVTIDRLRLTVNSTSGRWYWDEVAAVNEIEVIGRAAEPYPLLELYDLFLPMLER
jgi:hypothetical protein